MTLDAHHNAFVFHSNRRLLCTPVPGPDVGAAEMRKSLHGAPVWVGETAVSMTLGPWGGGERELGLLEEEAFFHDFWRVGETENRNLEKRWSQMRQIFKKYFHRFLEREEE